MILKTGLPIEEVIPQVCHALSIERRAVVQAPPGAGKTTIIPLALMDEPWLEGRRVIMLEPRRLAARAAAMRMASLLGEDAGKTVGYRTRLDSRVGPSTRIEVVTEGILTRYLQDDPSLEGAGCVIFDEFHERSLNADLGLALCIESRSILRDDLRLLVMSATLDGNEVSALLEGAPIIRSEGRIYPVEVRYRPEERPTGGRASLTGPAFISSVVAAVLSALKEESGSILVFLPGSAEIRRVESRLREKTLPDDTDLVPLYGELSREAQDFAIRPSTPGMRKVVLATSIAETSLTIDGVRVVIDSGLKRVPRFSPSTGMGSLETIRVTRDSSEQRKGRAGRTEPGVCMRLWTEAENNGLRDKATPEIMEADLASLALDLAVWGVQDRGSLKWLDEPPAASFEQATDVLKRLGAIDAEGKATRHGREIARLPLHPRLGHMVVKGKELGLGGLACVVAALLEERDIFKAGPDERDSDMRTRIDAVLGRGSHKGTLDRALVERVKAAARQLEKRLNIKSQPMEADRAGMLLALAYPDRIGKKREGSVGRFLLANGRGAHFRGPEPLSTREYIVAPSLDGADRDSVIYLAAPVEEAELERDFADEIEEIEFVEWDEAVKGVSARRQRKLWSLVLTDAHLAEPPAEKVLKAFVEGIRKSGLGVLPWDKASEGLRERVNFLNRVSEQTGVSVPGLSDSFLIENLEEWLGPFAAGMTRLEHLKRLDLKAALLSMLDWEKQKALEKLAPTHITVPTGSRIAIDYSQERPALAVRLQEMFGLAKTPSVAGGKVPLVVQLLSPAGRPVQVTDDLAGFWDRSYEMVKKEMKGRYPKHHWPDNPLEAEPTRRAKRRGE